MPIRVKMRMGTLKHNGSTENFPFAPVILDWSASSNHPSLQPPASRQTIFQGVNLPGFESGKTGGLLAGPALLSTSIARRQAFEAAMHPLGLPANADVVAVSDNYTEDEGSRCAEYLLDKQPEVTALLCPNDRLAIGAIDALQGRGLSCPADVSITGFNDIPFLDLIPPGLTTVQILQFDLGRIAAEILLKRMTEPDARVPETTIMPVSIIERGSIAPPRNGRASTQS